MIRYKIVPLEVPYYLHCTKLPSYYKTIFRSADVMIVVKHHVYFSIQGDNTMEIKFHYVNVDTMTKKPCFKQHFSLSFSFDMDDLVITFRNIMNAIKMYTCSDKHASCFSSSKWQYQKKNGNRNQIYYYHWL